MPLHINILSHALWGSVQRVPQISLTTYIFIFVLWKSKIFKGVMPMSVHIRSLEAAGLCSSLGAASQNTALRHIHRKRWQYYVYKNIREHHYLFVLSLSDRALLNTSFASISNSKIFTGIILADSRSLTCFLVTGYPSITTLHTNRNKDSFSRKQVPN